MTERDTKSLKRTARRRNLRHPISNGAGVRCGKSVAATHVYKNWGNDNLNDDSSLLTGDLKNLVCNYYSDVHKLACP
jgi:hypothetical protein